MPRTFAISLLCVASIYAAACSSDEDDEPGAGACNVHSDCANRQDLLKAVGRCFPKEAYCEAGSCKASCRELCEVVRADVNPCDDGLVCTDSASPEQELGYCSVLPVSCRTAVDCPLFRPKDDSGAQAEWECVEGYCAYPGL